MSLIKKAWMPECAMKRVIVHWTAGTYNASGVDKEHYHIVITKDGTLVKGDHSIADNVTTADDNYAQHTLNLNTKSIGISVCCMHDAVERPFSPGRFPMTKTQWKTLAKVAAELCDRYGIVVTPKTVLAHGEVQKNLGVRQRQKWDPMVLPWKPGLSKAKVGTEFRNLVKSHLSDTPVVEVLPKVKVVIKGELFNDAFLQDGGSFVMVRPVANKLGWTILRPRKTTVTLRVDGEEHKLPMVVEGGRGYVGCRDLADALGLDIGWNRRTRTVTLR